jgi:hypothetical protein
MAGATSVPGSNSGLSLNVLDYLGVHRAFEKRSARHSSCRNDAVHREESGALLLTPA